MNTAPAQNKCTYKKMMSDGTIMVYAPTFLLYWNWMQKSRPPLRFTSFLSVVNLPCDSVQTDKRGVDSTTALHDTCSLVHQGCIENRPLTSCTK